MCGICGFNFEDKSLIKKMCNLIIHRGPDDFGFYTDLDVSLGIRRRLLYYKHQTKNLNFYSFPY